MSKLKNRLGDMVNRLESSENGDGKENEMVKAKPLNTMATSVLKEGARENARLLEMIHSKYGGGVALPCLHIDPSQIRVGRFFNRLPQSFDESKNADFAELLDDVKRTGGNLVSGLVRPYKDESNSNIKYELVFGERRLKACIKAGVPFKAEIADITESEFIHLHSTENRFRPHLSIVESALQFKSWLNQRRGEAVEEVTVAKLAEEIGYSRTHYFRLQSIGLIDEDVLFNIPGVEKLTTRDTDKLCKTWKSDEGKEVILSRMPDLESKKLAGKDAIDYVCKVDNASTATKAKKITINVPVGFAKKAELFDKLKEIGKEFNLEFDVK